MISPHFVKLAAQFEDVDFYKVDVDDQEEIAAEVYVLAVYIHPWPASAVADESVRCANVLYSNVRAMPTFLIFHKGQKIDTVTGAVPAKLTVRPPHPSILTPSVPVARSPLDPPYPVLG